MILKGGGKMKTRLIVALACLVLIASGISFAQEGGQMCGPMGGQQQDQQQMQGGGMMQRPSPQMVYTGDGGVIILMGNKLQKYDKDLKLVKEVELKMEKREQPKQ